MPSSEQDEPPTKLRRHTNNLQRCVVAWRTWGEKLAPGTFLWVPCFVPAGWGREGELGLVVPYTHSDTGPFFFIRYLSLWINSESQMINTLPLGYCWQYWFFLRQHNNPSASLLPLCVFKQNFFSFTCPKKNFIFSVVNPPSLQQVEPQLFVVLWSSTVVGVSLKSSHHKKRLEISQQMSYSCT